MGKANSRLSPEQLNELQKVTYFDKKELQQWYRGFLRDCPAGQLDRAEFLRLYKQFFPFGDPSAFVDYVFHVFDQDKNGVVDFKEFMVALSVSSRGKLDERIECRSALIIHHQQGADFIGAFLLYDVDRDGYVSRDDLLKVVEAIYRMVGSMVKLPPDEETPERRVDKIMQMMDKDGDGRLSVEEFHAGSRQNPTLIQALSMYENVI